MSFSVDFCELDQYPRGQWNRQGFTGWRKLKVAWDDVETLINELMAYPNNLWPTGYYHLGSDWGILDDIKIEPIGAVSAHASSSSYNKYDWAVLTLTYVTRFIGMHNQIVVSEGFSGSITGQPMEYEGLQWHGTGLPVASHVVRRISNGHYSLTYHDRPVVPTAVWELSGYINDRPWASLLMDRVYPTGTLLMEAPLIRRRITSLGAQAWTYTVGFEVHPVGHNYVWNPGISNGDGTKGGYDYYVDSDGLPVILQPSANFNLLR